MKHQSRKPSDRLTHLLIVVLFLLTIGIVFALIGFIAVKGMGQLSLEFLFESPKGFPQGKEGGIFPAITGSLLSMGLALIPASILAVFTAVFNVFFNPWPALRRFVHLMNKNVAGLPSILFGLFGYGIFIVVLGMERSLLSAGLTLATMAFPYIEIHTEKTLHELDPKLMRDARSLGIADGYIVFRLLLPLASRQIISGLLLAGAYVMGATAPVILTGAVLFAKTPQSWNDPIMSLPFHLNMLLSQGISTEKAYGTAFVLILLLVIINACGSS